MEPSGGDQPARYVIGIDLGTTNSAAAYVDSSQPQWKVLDFAIPQLVAPGQVEAREVLPSFHYEAAAGEFDPAALRLPWSGDEPPRVAVGLFAREHGAAVPGRLIASAKSWLSHSGVDRTAGLLPWHGAADATRLSPVEVSSRYLSHIRLAWDAAHPEHPLAQQEIVLAVPASFDEVARELTLQAAQRAGLARVVLVEEPQAAFYAWIAAQGVERARQVRAGQSILICDVGGGTTDFTLIRVEPAANGGVRFHRTAVGQHLILGGDNLDLALAHFVEGRLGDQKLELRQWGALLRASRVVKETLLGAEPPERMTLSLADAGSKLIGGAVQVELTRSEVQSLLVDGFLPHVELTARPAARGSGFREFGLPFASDAAITRYLAAFLCAHLRPASTASSPGAVTEMNAASARPDLVLLNGGMFESPVLRERLIEVLSSWFSAAGNPWRPSLLQNDRPDLAVSRGAAYHGMVRRGKGVRISGGLAHAYYLGVDTAAGAGEPQAICLLPAGIEQGQTIDLDGQKFSLRIRQPAEFPLYFSSTRTTDAPGQIVPVDPEQLSSLPPIRTVLQSGRRAAAAQTVSVTLHARLTEIGTLDIWCTEIGEEGRWRLQFDVRAATRSDAGRHTGTGEAAGTVDEKTQAMCRQIVREAFTLNGASPGGVMKRLEEVAGAPRNDWPPSLLRGVWETLIELEPARRISVEHEARWLSLSGFALRPGYGLAVDDWRVGQMWRLFQGGVLHPKNELCRAEWWILWRRIAGGLTASQQTLIADPLVADWRSYVRKNGIGVRGRSPSFQFGAHESAEVWRALGSLELVRPPLKLELGGIIFSQLAREKSAAARDALLFALGRLGARTPVYGPLNTLLPREEIESWLGRLLERPPSDDRLAFTLVQLARRTTDRYRDISEPVRSEVLAWLATRGTPEYLVDLVREGGALQAAEQRSVFGESLPRGLRIE